ncbi:MAG TPA: dephospho-CoA kinase [bacterium]|nr:dephospho-CoA kinase [bacterium]
MRSGADGPTGRPVPFRPEKPLVIGLVGGVAAGKTTVSELFAAHGIRHINADEFAREVARDPEVVAAVAADLGHGFVRDGALDRPALAARVFADADARRRLEEIVHPRVRARIRAELATARSAGETALLDVPLLFEAGLAADCDTIVFVAADDEVRERRARARGWPPGELQRRERHQLPLHEKRARSQHVIDNGSDLARTRAAVAAVLAELGGDA